MRRGVSLRDHLAELRQDDRRLGAVVAAAIAMAVWLMRQADQVAIGKAFDSSKELADKHNDLIRAAEKKDESYATKTDVGRLEKWQAKITGGMVLLAAIGFGNLVKLWLA